MRTTRSRLLLVVATAAFIVSLFTHWDDLARGFRHGYDPARTSQPTR